MTFPVLSANGPSGYNLTRSLRFRSSASAYLRRVPTSSTNAQKFTLSMWRKLGVSEGKYLAAANQDTLYVTFDEILISSGSNFIVRSGVLGVSYTWTLTSNAVFRDPSSWYHIVVAYDTTQATDTNRVKVWVNNQQLTFTGTYPVQNYSTAFDTTAPQYLSSADGYYAEVNWVDGQQLTPSSFGSTNSTTGVWQPAAYTGTYGTNGFYLPFTNTTSTTTLGYDSSGNGNNWTTNNISLTTGVTYDSMIDVPTLTSATAANYCTLNPVNASSAATLTNGNLKIRSSAQGTNSFAIGTIAVPASKIYFEATAGDNTGAVVIVPLGLYAITSSGGNSYTGLFDGCRCINGDFEYVINGNQTSLGGGGVTAGTVIGMAYDLVSNVMSIYRNGTAVLTNQALGTAKTAIMAGVYRDTSNDVGWELNFGQQPFAYSAPSGYVALNTYNLPASTVPNGAAYMAATLYTGTGATQTITNTVGSASFQPDLFWAKSRPTTDNNILYDSVRGVSKYLSSNLTVAEGTASGVTSFNSNGVTVGSDPDSNRNGYAYIGWQWKAGGTAVSNTSGSITSSVSANTTSGFSALTFTSPSSAGNFTVGHGLGVAPQMVITKRRDSASQWWVWNIGLGDNTTSYLSLNTTNAVLNATGMWGSIGRTSSLLGFSDTSLSTSSTFVVYCFAAIKGFSAFGSYTGNGSTDGTFVYTGFRPRWVLVKSSSAIGNWQLLDTSRSTYNVSNANLYPNLSNAEVNGGNEDMDILSNGFKPRNASASFNVSGTTYVYAAFAENPFSNALAR